MPLEAADITAAHAVLGSVEEILRERRTLYRVLAELTGEFFGAALDDAVLDNPMVRGHLGAAFTGVPSSVDTSDPRSARYVAPGYADRVAGHEVRLASTSEARELVAPALHRLHEALRHNGLAVDGATVLTVADGERTASAYRMLVDGVRLAAVVAPALVADLLPHAGLFVVTDRESTGRLGSASAREFPGLVILPEPGSPAEAAEALVHEGAHLKFFDMAMTHSILADGHWRASALLTSWARPDAPGWPVEQAFAAWHAYSCLSVLAESFAAEGVEPAAGSLLPVAAARATEIGEWLLDQGGVIGPDGHALLGGILGRRPVDGAQPSGLPTTGVLGVHECGRRSLLVVDGDPVQFRWTTTLR